MIIASLYGAVALFLKYGTYLVGLRICTASLEVLTAYAKHRVTGGRHESIN